MVPNHVFTLLSMVAMEPPVGFDAAAIRSKKAEVFAAMPAVKPAEAVRGQYGAGTVLGKKVEGLSAGAQRCAGFERRDLRRACSSRSTTGAGRACRSICAPASTCRSANTEIAIRFKQAPYARVPGHARRRSASELAGAAHRAGRGHLAAVRGQAPGPVMDLAAGEDGFRYDDWFPKEPNVGYETLIYDVMIGDPTLFMRADMVEQTWRIVQPVLDAWAKGRAADLPIYPAGSAGPSEADALLAKDGRTWRGVGGDHDGPSS